MKHRVGIIGPSRGWEQLCKQEGIPCITIDPLVGSIESECSVIVVSRALSPPERPAVEQYLRDGGGIIGYTNHLRNVAGTDGVDMELSYVVSEGGDIFRSVQLLDVGVRGSIPRGANTMRTEANTFAIAAGPLGGGFAVLLPFDVAELVNDDRPANKNFYFTVDRLPSERVSLVAKGELMHLVHDAFVYLHHARGIPYLHLWYFPRDLRNVFAFRIDTDGAPREDIDALYRLGRDHDLTMSWFVDVKSHEAWLGHFSFFVDQEIGLHCYEHRVYETFEENAENIARGMRLAERAGIRPKGFAAPYGMWNGQLGKAIDGAGFEYSSEFSYAYDALPMIPGQFKTLQVPVHPICIGSLLKVGYTPAQMDDYFSWIVGRKLQRNEPLFFYHHPSHRQWEVTGHLFDHAKAPGIENMSLGAYARWWMLRAGTNLTLESVGHEVRCIPATGFPSTDVWLRIIHPRLGEAKLPLAGSVNLNSVGWMTPDPPDQAPVDIRRMREFDARRVIGELYSNLVRRNR